MTRFAMRLGRTAALLVAVLSTAPAGAQACVNGVYRAGCVGPRGAVAIRKRPPPAVVVAPRPVPRAVVVAPAARAVVVAPAPRCRWVNGLRVCR